MIEHVYERASRAGTLDRVVVLTDDERIAAAVEAFGGHFEMTPVDCSSGTDRVAWAAKAWQVQAVINIQGDEPLIDPEAIDRFLAFPRHQPVDEPLRLDRPHMGVALRVDQPLMLVLARQVDEVLADLRKACRGR